MLSSTTTTSEPRSGYYPCGCRDCFEIAVGQPGEFCSLCDEHGCEPDAECASPFAYGCDDDATRSEAS